MNSPTPLTSQQKKKLRQIAHHLDPVVSVGVHGTSDNVMAETMRALDDHELIKVRVAANDRAHRVTVVAALAQGAGAEVIQQIGNVAVLYRPNEKADPKLSNIARHLGSREL